MSENNNVSNENVGEVQHKIEVTADSSMKKIKKKHPIRVIILMLLIIALIGVGVYFVVNLNKEDNTSSNNGEVVESTRVTTSSENVKSIVVYELSYTGNYTYSYKMVTYLDEYDESNTPENYTKSIKEQYNCQRECAYYRVNDSSQNIVYIYDGGVIVKNNLDGDDGFKELDVEISEVEISKYSIILTYFEDDGNFVGFDVKPNGTILDPYRAVSDASKFYYSKNLLENGYVIVESTTGVTVYDYKNKKVVDSSDDVDYVNVYDYFVDYGNGLKSNNLITIVEATDDYSSTYSVSGEYVYLIEDNHISKYDKDGNLISKTDDYKAIFNGVIDNYALILDSDNYVKLIEVSSSKILVNYKIELDSSYDVVNTEEMDGIIQIALMNDCGQYFFTYEIESGEYDVLSDESNAC